MVGPMLEFSFGLLSQHSSPFSQIPDLGVSVGLGDKMLVAQPHNGRKWALILRPVHGDETVLAEGLDPFLALEAVVRTSAAINVGRQE